MVSRLNNHQGDRGGGRLLGATLSQIRNSCENGPAKRRRPAWKPWRATKVGIVSGAVALGSARLSKPAQSNASCDSYSS